MRNLTVSDFLKDSQTHLTSVYGNLVSIFQQQNDLSRSPLIYCAFANGNGDSFSFRFNTESLEIDVELFVIDKQRRVCVLTQEDTDLIQKVLPIYFERLARFVKKVTKTMKEDWGRKFKTEVLERSGFTEYLSSEAADIKNYSNLNIFNHTLSTIDRSRAPAFQLR